MNCITCGLLIPEPGKSYSTVLPMCQFAGNHQALPYRYPYAPNDAGSHDQQGCRPFRYMTEDDVRRIVREELSRSDNE